MLPTNTFDTGAYPPPSSTFRGARLSAASSTSFANGRLATRSSFESVRAARETSKAVGNRRVKRR
jgi:hypothetical protein